MEIQIKGKPTKARIDQIKVAAEWYANRLMGPKLAKNIHVIIKFKKGLLANRSLWAECNTVGRTRNPRHFEIILDSDSGNRTTLITLAHEMTHVKQYARGELVEVELNRLWKWNGELMGEEVCYWEQPWEIEAHGRETGLYNMWRDSDA